MDGKPGNAISSVRLEELLDMSDQRQKSTSKAPATPEPARGSGARLGTAKVIVEKTYAQLGRLLRQRPDQKELAAWALMETFDVRLTEAEQRIDRVLARLKVE